jgi:hypothetical protein
MAYWEVVYAAFDVQPVDLPVSHTGKIWRCGDCQVWWGSQVGTRWETTFLLDLPGEVLSALPWDQYRGWRRKPAEAGVCPECKGQIAQPFYAHLENTPQRAAQTM